MKLKSEGKYDVVVISPHMDDAVLSLGQHIIDWVRMGKVVKVVTVFTKFSGENLTAYSADYVSKSGFENLADFEVGRVKEDVMAMKKLGVDWEHWDFVDAGFRGNYPTKDKLLSGVIELSEMDLILKIRSKIYQTQGTLLLPYGVGGHVDHLIVKQAGEIEGKKIMYYLDSPYMWQRNNFVKHFWKLLWTKSFKRSGTQKDSVLRSYKSQYLLLTKYNNLFAEVIV